MLSGNMADKPLIFVSCGQYHSNEKQLGNDICSLLAELRPDTSPYFAEDQSTVDGLSNIFCAHFTGLLALSVSCTGAAI
jgi:hypothetical protein